MIWKARGLEESLRVGYQIDRRPRIRRPRLPPDHFPPSPQTFPNHPSVTCAGIPASRGDIRPCPSARARERPAAVRAVPTRRPAAPSSLHVSPSGPKPRRHAPLGSAPLLHAATWDLNSLELQTATARSGWSAAQTAVTAHLWRWNAARGTLNPGHPVPSQLRAYPSRSAPPAHQDRATPDRFTRAPVSTPPTGVHHSIRLPVRRATLAHPLIARS